MHNETEMFEFLKHAHDIGIKLTANFHESNFSKINPRHRIAMAFYCSILELTGSCICLINNKAMIGVPILFRVILEAYVNLINTINIDDYYLRIEAGFLEERIAIIEQAKKGNNELLDVYANVSNEKLIELKNAKKKRHGTIKNM